MHPERESKRPYSDLLKQLRGGGHLIPVAHRVQFILDCVDYSPPDITGLMGALDVLAHDQSVTDEYLGQLMDHIHMRIEGRFHDTSVPRTEEMVDTRFVGKHLLRIREGNEDLNMRNEITHLHRNLDTVIEERQKEVNSGKSLRVRR